MDSRLKWTMRGERRRESKRGGLAIQERWPGQETSVAKMAELYRDQAGEREMEASP